MDNMVESKSQTILVVDDVAKNIQLVASFLTKAGYQINFAVDGESAIDHAIKGNFDLILLDIMMPGLDGIEVCRRLKANKITADIPIIFLTAKTDDESFSRGFEAGGVDYITKPFNPAELLGRVKTHLNLRRRERELRELNATKDTILSIIGHDLKTPMANIISLGEIITNSDDISEDQRDELIRDLVDSGQQGVWLLDNLLSWTRIQTGNITNTPEEIEVEKIIKQNVDFVHQNAQYKDIKIKVSCKDSLKIFADINIVHTIVRNLLSNGIKFTHQGGQISISAFKNDTDEICIEVEDTGIGIEESKLDNLFSSMGANSTDGTQNEKGSGLGLMLVKDLIDILKARISVVSEVDKGTTFSVFFKEYR